MHDLVHVRLINNINVNHLRRILGVVEQEPKLFSTSIHKNLMLGLEPSPPGALVVSSFETDQKEVADEKARMTKDKQINPEVGADLEMAPPNAVLQRKIQGTMCLLWLSWRVRLLQCFNGR